MKTGSATMLKEPLLHFLLIGAALFGAYAVVAEPAPSDDGRRIVVTAGEVERLASYWEKRRLRPPTDGELAGMIDEYVREEVLYREALALGLDRDDAVIRRLMRQKYEFVAQDLTVAPEPDRKVLSAWYDANRERYRSAPRLSFAQVHFDIDRRGSEGERDARLVLAGLRGGASPEALGAGDGGLLDPGYRDVSARDVAALFGQDFADAILGLETGIWSGPVRSGFGLHLVRVGERTEGAVPPFEAVEAQVLADWTYEQRQTANDAIFARLLERYEVVVEGAPDAAAGGQERR